MAEIENSELSTFSSHQEIHNLIGNPPGCLLKSGITIIALAIFTILLMSSFIRYPDKIVADGEITGDFPPILHVNKISGVIDTLYKKDGQGVKKGNRIVYIQNTMNRTHLRRVIRFIRDYQNIEHIEDYADISLDKNLQLANLTPDYARLQLLFDEFQSLIRQSGITKQIKTIVIEIQKTRLLASTLQNEKKYSKKELELIEKNLQRDIDLLKDGLVSHVEKERKERELLIYQKRYNNLDIGIIQNSIKEEQLRSQIQQLTEERNLNLKNYRFNIQEVINRINQQIKEWEDKYYIQAEVSGKLVLLPNISQDLFVQPNKPLFSIISDKKQFKKYARVITPARGVGKISEGDKVILKLEGYPYKEYGVVISEIQTISILPNKDNKGNKYYEVKVPLLDTLTTNYGKVIQYKPQSSVTAEIITKDKSILERITEQMLNLILN